MVLDLAGPCSSAVVVTRPGMIRSRAAQAYASVDKKYQYAVPHSMHALQFSSSMSQLPGLRLA
jgi:hypothetical protein